MPVGPARRNPVVNRVRLGANRMPLVHAAPVAAELQAAFNQVFIGDIPLPWMRKANTDKPPKPPKITKALPNGRMKNVRLGDILKAYKPKLMADGFVLVDFRVPKVGDYFMNKRWEIKRVAIGTKIVKIAPSLIFEYCDNNFGEGRDE